MRSRRKSNGSVLSVATAIPRFCSARQFGYEGPKIAPLILYVESGKIMLPSEALYVTRPS